MQYYDVNKPVTLSVDASKYGLGAVLLQDRLPVAYASKALTQTEIRYAQIEKEALAISFGCLKFDQYIYGKQIIIETDHKPHESIFQKSIKSHMDFTPKKKLKLRNFSTNKTVNNFSDLENLSVSSTKYVYF